MTMYDTEIDICLHLPLTLTPSLPSPSHHPSSLPQLTGHGRIGQCSHNPNERSQQSVWCGGSLQWSPEQDTPHITATGRPKAGMTATQSRWTIMVNILVSINDDWSYWWRMTGKFSVGLLGPLALLYQLYHLILHMYEYCSPDLTRTIRASKISHPLEAAVVLRHWPTPDISWCNVYADGNSIV